MAVSSKIAREVAWRVFAHEYTNSTCVETKGGERLPSYVITPLGAKVNRLFIVGTLTSTEDVGSESTQLIRARVADPTGVFYVYAGQYQPQVLQYLKRLEPPVFIAIVGKSRTFTPESGRIYVSVRPEVVKKVDAATRRYWILSACKSTKERLEAMREALQMDPPTIEKLTALGFNRNLASGVVLATQHYSNINLEEYYVKLLDALRELIPVGEEPPEELILEELEKPVPELTGFDESYHELKQQFLALMERLDPMRKGIDYNTLVDACKREGLERDKVEEVVNALKEDNTIVEPKVNILKRA